jgi:dolichol kinase
VLLRPLALAFPIMYLWIPKEVMLLLVGSVTLLFLAVDLSRIVSPTVDAVLLDRAHVFFRPAESRRMSTATLFLCGTFLTLFLYPKPVASLAIIFAILGDLVAKYVGSLHGKIRLFGGGDEGRTLEGSLAYLLTCALAGAAWSLVVPLTPAQWLVGAIAAAGTEALPIDLDDNFTVPLISGAVMTIPAYFGVPGF